MRPATARDLQWLRLRLLDSTSAQQRWRAVNAPHLVELVRVGARFERGWLVERPQTTAA